MESLGQEHTLSVDLSLDLPPLEALGRDDQIYHMNVPVPKVPTQASKNVDLENVNLEDLERADLNALAMIEYSYLGSMGFNALPGIEEEVENSRRRLHCINAEIFRRDEEGLSDQGEYGAFTKENVYLSEEPDDRAIYASVDGKAVEQQYDDLRDQEEEKLRAESEQYGLDFDNPLTTLNYMDVGAAVPILRQHEVVDFESRNMESLRNSSSMGAAEKDKTSGIFATLKSVGASLRSGFSKLWNPGTRKAIGIGAVAVAATGMSGDGYAERVKHTLTPVASTITKTVSPWVEAAESHQSNDDEESVFSEQDFTPAVSPVSMPSQKVDDEVIPAEAAPLEEDIIIETQKPTGMNKSQPRQDTVKPLFEVENSAAAFTGKSASEEKASPWIKKDQPEKKGWLARAKQKVSSGWSKVKSFFG